LLSFGSWLEVPVALLFQFSRCVNQIVHVAVVVAVAVAIAVVVVVATAVVLLFIF